MNYGDNFLVKPTSTNNVKTKVNITTNIVNEEETRLIIGETLNLLDDVLSKTLGPYGSTTIIQDRFLNHNMCKDGYTVLKSLMIKEDAPRTVLDLVQKISRNLVRKVGDGSTSSIIIANRLFKELNNIMTTRNIPPKTMLDILNIVSEEISVLIKDEAIQITSDDLSPIEKIATISTNNDKEVAKLIRQIFEKVGEFGFIHVEKSSKPCTYIDDTSGFEIHRGYTNALMATEDDEKTCIQKSPTIFMTDSYLGEEDMDVMMNLIGTVALQGGAPIVLLCKGTDTAFDTFVHMNMQKNKQLPLLVVDISTQSKSARERFDDLAINLGCDPVRRSEGEEMPQDVSELLKRCGSCKKVISTEIYTRFIEGSGDRNSIDRRLNKIKDLLDKEFAKEGAVDNDDTIYELKKRMSLLQNTMATIFVGGATEQEKDTKKYLVEDAVFACKSALKNGYILGGNLIIPYVILNKKEKLINSIMSKLNILDLNLLAKDTVDAIESSFKYSFERVLKNMKGDEDINHIIEYCLENYKIYNLLSNKYESIENTTVINSSETDIEIMKSAFSIIGLLATSNQLIKINFRDIQ